MGNGQTSCFECFDVPDFIISIRTGDTKGAGLHDAVYITLINNEKIKSRPVHLSGCCMTVFKKGRTDEFNVHQLPDFGHVKKIMIQQHEEQKDVDWFIDKIVVRHISLDDDGKVSVFPVHRWLRFNKPLILSEYDCSLPQFDEEKEQRKAEITIKQISYGYQKNRGMPPQVSSEIKRTLYLFGTIFRHG